MGVQLRKTNSGAHGAAVEDQEESWAYSLAAKTSPGSIKTRRQATCLRLLAGTSGPLRSGGLRPHLGTPSEYHRRLSPAITLKWEAAILISYGLGYIATRCRPT